MSRERKLDAAKTLVAKRRSAMTSPRLPHEHDESSEREHTSEPKLRTVIKQAHDDIVSGKKDTDLHGTPGLDKPVR
jgi:hypothetical protein